MDKILVALLLCSVVGYGRSLDVGLNDGWTIRNGNGSIVLHNQTVPSGVYSALELAGLAGSVLHGLNDVQLRWVSRDVWTYALQFNGMDYLYIYIHIW